MDKRIRTMIDKIYLDCDGIISNFRKQCETYNCIEGTKVDWDIIHSLGTNFWEEIEWIPEGKEFYEWVKKLCSEENIELFILTAVHSTDGKIGRMNWLKKNLGLNKHHLIITNTGKEKAYYAEPSALLIDDFKKNCNAFSEAGGLVVKYESPQQAKDEIIELLGKY